MMSDSFQINFKKLKKIEKDYQIHLEQLAQLEDPMARMEVGKLVSKLLYNIL